MIDRPPTVSHRLQVCEGLLTASRDAHKRAEHMIGDQLKQIDQLRTALATVKAENLRLQRLFQNVHGCHSGWVARGDQAERELAETRKALELQTELNLIALRGEQTARAALAESEARVKQLEAKMNWSGPNG